MSVDERTHRITLAEGENGRWVVEGYEDDTAGRTPFEALGKFYEVAAEEAGFEWPPSGAGDIDREELDRRADELWSEGGVSSMTGLPRTNRRRIFYPPAGEKGTGFGTGEHERTHPKEDSRDGD